MSTETTRTSNSRTTDSENSDTQTKNSVHVSLMNPIGDYTKVYIDSETERNDLGNDQRSCRDCYINRQSSGHGITDLSQHSYHQQHRVVTDYQHRNMADNQHTEIDMGDLQLSTSHQDISNNNNSTNCFTNSNNTPRRDQTSYLPAVNGKHRTVDQSSCSKLPGKRQQSVYPTTRRWSVSSSLYSYKPTSRCCLTSTRCSCLLSMTALLCSLLLFGYVFYKNNFQITPEEVHQQLVTDLPKTAALQGLEQARLAGRFVMQSPYFNSTTNDIIWRAVDPENTDITVYGPCLVVPETGTYAVFSLITFRVYKEDDVAALGQYLNLHNAQENEQMFQRRVTSVPVSADRGNPEYIPSSLVTFVGMNAGGKICVTVSQHKFVYRSSLDNSMNIFKL